VPFVSKATAVPLAKAAARIALGATIAELRAEGLLPAAATAGRCPTPRRSRSRRRCCVQAVPHHRGQGRGQPARPGDEVDRRGDGHRHVLRASLRQVAGGRLRLAADRRHRPRHRRQPGQAGDRVPGEEARRPGLSRSSPPPVPARSCAGTAWPARSFQAFRRGGRVATRCR
jgi:carbamoyl-phosphate synthase large subunit